VFAMKREEFSKAVGEALDSLPAEFRSKIRNVAVLVEDLPPNPIPSEPGQPRRILLGLFHGVPMTQKSVFAVPSGPDYVVLYKKNIEAVCSTEAEVREQIRRTLVHEMGHYFGMTEEQVRNMESAGEVGGPMRK
jgi:predicted Zn-dependent protease with MMP-like domain